MGADTAPALPTDAEAEAEETTTPLGDAGEAGTDAGPKTKGLVYGANLHANADYGNGAQVAVDSQFQLMQARNLTAARIGGVPDPSTNPATEAWIASGKSHAIALSFMLDFAWIVCPSDARTFASNDATTNHDAAYQATLAFVTPLRNDITDWELGNEIDLTAGQSQPPGLWNTGWAASEWKNVSANGSADYFGNWAAAVKGAADAIATVAYAQYGTHLRRILNTTSTPTSASSTLCPRTASPTKPSRITTTTRAATRPTRSRRRS